MRADLHTRCIEVLIKCEDEEKVLLINSRGFCSVYFSVNILDSFKTVKLSIMQELFLEERLSSSPNLNRSSNMYRADCQRLLTLINDPTYWQQSSL